MRDPGSLKANERFVGLPQEFWASVRTVSEKAGYTAGTGFLVPTPARVVDTYASLDLDPSDLVLDGGFTEAGALLAAYMKYRGDVLQRDVHGWLMNADEAAALYQALAARHRPRSKQPRNNQGRAKGAPRYFTCIINMLVESVVGMDCDYDPQQLTAVTVARKPLRTLARRLDGAYPSAVNPVAVWEIKEYYHTISFGSRVADGVYVSLLDGMELEEMREHTGISIRHYLMLDAKDNWWQYGRSYLCKVVDMLHMGYVDEVLFGREVVERLPMLAAEWMALHPVADARRAAERRLL